MDPVRVRLQVEADTFGLRWACEECAHFAPVAERCAHRYPTEAHRRVALVASQGAASGNVLDAFCKEFELA